MGNMDNYFYSVPAIPFPIKMGTRERNNIPYSTHAKACVSYMRVYFIYKYTLIDRFCSQIFIYKGNRIGNGI
jgi:hypothetical protein